MVGPPGWAPAVAVDLAQTQLAGHRANVLTNPATSLFEVTITSCIPLGLCWKQAVLHTAGLSLNNGYRDCAQVNASQLAALLEGR